MSTIKSIAESLDPKNPGSIAQATMEALGYKVKVGDMVAVTHDPTYPYDGQKGKVKSINNGMADVTFANNITVSLQVSLLVPM